MQKNSRLFTFLFSYSTKSSIKIRRVTVSKKLVQSGSITVFLVTVISLLSLGLNGVVKDIAFAKSLDRHSLSGELAAAHSDQQYNPHYSHHAPSEAIAINSGGPVDTDDVTIGDP